jgi:hypothetical protein
VQTCSINTIISISAEAFWKTIGKLSSNSLGIFKSVAKPLAEPAGIIPKLHLHFPMIQRRFYGSITGYNDSFRF